MTTQLRIRFFAIFSCLFVIALLSLYFYARPVPATLSKEHQVATSTLLSHIPNSVAIFILKVDLPSNSRYVFYRHELDDLLKSFDDEYFNHTSVSKGMPLFTKEQDANQRIIRLINHQFDCAPYSATIRSKVIPETNKIVKSVCSIAIPPSFGFFTGYVTVYLTKEPTADEQANIRLLIKEFSETIQNDLGN
jgi:hypothetical protein